MLKNQSVWYLYMIRTQKNHLYTGITTNVERRFNQHISGKGAKALRGKGPLTLVYQLNIGNRSDALKLEYRIKQQSKQQKEQLVKCQPSLSLLFNQLLSD